VTVVHRTGRATLQTLVDRAVHRTQFIARGESDHYHYVLHRAKYKRHWRSKEVADAEKKINEKHGLAFAKARTPFEVMLHMNSSAAATKLRDKRIREAEAIENDNPRALAEFEMRDIIEKAIGTISFKLQELTHIPNPTKSYKNMVNQLYVIEAIRKLACSVTPPIPFSFDVQMTRQPPVRLPADRICANCGGPGRRIMNGEWVCAYCDPEV